MTDKQPEALRLAKILDSYVMGSAAGTKKLAAAELRRLHQSEREGWRYADELEQERKRLHEVNAELVEALSIVIRGVPDTWEGVQKAKAVLDKAKGITMNNVQPEVRSDLDYLHCAISADTEALEDAKMTLEVIKKTDPGVYDEMINDTLSLIRKALSNSILGVIDKLAHPDARKSPYGYVWFTHYMEMRFTRHAPNEREKVGDVIPVYTAPYKREWQGLTDEEIHHGFCHVEYETLNDWHKNPEGWCIANARYLEAILKEKNT